MTERDVFIGALQRDDPGERRAFLDAACGADPALRRRVEGLLAVYDRAGSFLEGPAGTGAYDPPAPGEPVTDREGPGAAVGPYKLLQRLGEGGMGEVWMAEQLHPVQRKVALKLIKPGMDSRQVLARFEAERQALALMDHPNIARVFDGGATPAGRPFFVMELVKGVPITRYCDDHRLTPRERLELFADVCRAVQHAHQKGIIHRDLKPSNVLVAPYDGRPVVKVIDFGVAKATGQRLTDRTLFTELGAVVGTLEYMSPEQAELNNQDIDTRSDVYSLGVLLYELLTGTTPLDRPRLKQAAFAEVLRMIREEEPPKPSTRLSASQDALPAISARRQTEPAKLTRLVRGELDWIVMTALEKDRSRRYESANGFAMDVQRFLADEPVQACPPSAGYRLRKFVRRNRGPVVAAALVILALSGGVAGTTVGLVRAEGARAAEAEQRGIAQGNEQKALALAAAEREAKREAEAREAEARAVLEYVDRRIFAAARPKYQAGGLGREVTLRAAVEAALPHVAAGFRDQPLVEARVRLSLGLSLDYLGDPARAAEQFRAAHRLYARHRGPAHPDTLRALNNLANSYADLGRLDEVVRLREECLAATPATMSPDDPFVLQLQNNLANSYADLGRRDHAFRLRLQTRDRLLARHGPDHPDTLTAQAGLAASHTEFGRHDEALKLHREVLDRSERVRGAAHPDTLWAMYNVANGLAAVGRPDEALALHRKTAALMKDSLGPDHADTLSVRNSLANVYHDLGRHEDALKIRTDLVSRYEAKFSREHPDALMAMHNLANSYAALGRHREALKLREETVGIKKKLRPDHPDTLGTMSSLANSYAAVGRTADALKLHKEVVALREARLGRDDPDTLLSLGNLALTLLQVGDGAEAVRVTDDLLSRSAGKPIDPRVIPGTMVARLRHFARKKDAAGCRETAERWEDLNRPDPESLVLAARMRAVAAAALRAGGQPEAAAAEADRAVGWLRKAIAAGFREGPRLESDADFGILRDRADFRELLNGLADKPPPAAGK